jgi:hypothetical protein
MLISPYMLLLLCAPETVCRAVRESHPSRLVAKRIHIVHEEQQVVHSICWASRVDFQPTSLAVAIIVASSATVDAARLSAKLALAEVAVTKDAQNGSGIAGQIVIRPIRPHATLGVPNSQPYQATIEVLDSTGRSVTTFQTDSDGNFRVPLTPGKYLLRPQSGGPYPRASEQTVIVSPGNFTQVRINYDSGIR